MLSLSPSEREVTVLRSQIEKETFIAGEVGRDRFSIGREKRNIMRIASFHGNFADETSVTFSSWLPPLFYRATETALSRS